MATRLQLLVFTIFFRNSSRCLAPATRSVFGLLSLDCVNQLTFLETKLGTLLLPTLMLIALFAWHRRTRHRIKQGEDGLNEYLNYIEARSET